VTSNNQPSKTSDNQTALKQYKKALCKNSDACAVCNLEPEKLKLLEELYIAGTPSPVLYSYFNIPSKDLGYHAYYLNWHKQKAKLEDPRRKKAVKEALENEVWQTIMSSEASGSTGDRIAAMKLVAQMQGLVSSQKTEAHVNISFEHLLAEVERGEKQGNQDHKLLDGEVEEGNLIDWEE